MADGSLTLEVQNVQQTIGDLTLDAIGMRPSLRAEQELILLTKTFPLLIWEFKEHIKEAVYFFYDIFEPENEIHMNPNAFPESCRESDESDCQSRARKAIMEDVSWQFEQTIMSHGKTVYRGNTRKVEDMFFYIFYQHLGKRRRDRSLNRPRLKLQGNLLENKLQRDQEERQARVLDGLKQRLAMRTKLDKLSERSIEIIKKVIIPDETDCISKPAISDQQLLNELPAVNDFSELSLEWVRQARNSPTVTEIPYLHVPELQRIDCDVVLDNLLSRTMDFHSKRYGNFLHQQSFTGIKKLLWGSLTMPVERACKDGKFNLERLKSFGGNPYEYQGPGIYLHILWKQNNINQFWLYTGQANDLSQRIRNHNDPDYRQIHPCLHYHVWNSQENIESMFVTLATFENVASEFRHYVLNLGEMWMACILQTLRTVDLRKYLPQISMPWAGLHLNVAPPIWQRFPGEVNEIALGHFKREDFINFLFSDKPHEREYVMELRSAYNDLYYSPDVRLRQYYLNNQKRASILGTNAWQRQKYMNYQQLLNVGAEVMVKEASGTLRIFLHDYSFLINRRLEAPVTAGDLVHVQLFLSNSPSPLRYCQKALSSDPSSRLLVLIKNNDAIKQGMGREFHRWLFSNGPDVSQRVNSLVDTLEGMSYEDSTREQRRIRRRRKDGKLVTIRS